MDSSKTTRDLAEIVREVAAKMSQTANCLEKASASVGTNDLSDFSQAMWDTKRNVDDMWSVVQKFNHPLIETLEHTVRALYSSLNIVNGTLCTFNVQTATRIFAIADCQRAPARALLQTAADYADGTFAVVTGGQPRCCQSNQANPSDGRLKLEAFNRPAKQLLDQTLTMLPAALAAFEQQLRSGHFVCATSSFIPLRIRVQDLIWCFERSIAMDYDCLRFVQVLTKPLTDMCKPGYWHFNMLDPLLARPERMLAAADELASMQVKAQTFFQQWNIPERSFS